MKLQTAYTTLRLILMVMICLVARSATAKDIIVGNDRWKIVYNESKKTFDLFKKGNDNEFHDIVLNSTPTATYDHEGSEGIQVDGRDFSVIEYKSRKMTDNFGKGVCHSFIFSSPINGDKITLRQDFHLYKNTREYILTRLTLSSENGEVRTNYLAPINVIAPYRLLQANENNRILRVPFDNDGFVRYHKYKLDKDVTSYEVTSIYEGESRKGIVLGSIEHNRWKSAVRTVATDHGVISHLCLFSGASDESTRDVLPHGKCVGKEISSALMYVGYHDDWRNGLEQYAMANTIVTPGRDTWKRGTPFGWQSWGVMAEKNSYEVDTDVSDYFCSVLRPAGFCNSEGLNIMSIDAWDNLSREKRIALVAHCKKNGQIAGTYLTPFCLWWNEDMLHTRKLFAGSEYYGYDCVIKVNGKPYKLDGAYCLDPTHPGTREMMSRDVQRIKSEGFEYVKVDFTSNGMVQADSYYDENIKTAVEAYNAGFAHFVSEADKGEPLFIALSIAPIFPYQYGNSRRIACDTWGKIGHSEYSMNAVGAGWWTNGFYQYNDPDHLVLVGNDDIKENEGENRARVTNGAVSGMVLVSDNFSKEHGKGRGNAQLSFERATKVLMNKDIIAIANLGRSFRPVYGYREYNNAHDGAEECVMLETPEYIYVAVFNYTHQEKSDDIPFEVLGTSTDCISEIKELWSDTIVTPIGQSLSYTIPATDAKIFRLTKIK